MAENRDAYAVAFTAYQQLRERVYKHLKSLKDLESHGKADPDPKQLDCSWCEEQNVLQSCLEAEKEKVFQQHLSFYIFILMKMFFIIPDSENVQCVRNTRKRK